MKTEDYAQVPIESISDLRSWLQKNHTQKHSVWLVTYKKSVPEKYVSRSDIVDELLCFGWVDGILRALDEERTMHFVSPRQTHHWTKWYKDRYEKLRQLGKMTLAGEAAVASSKASGLWDFMNDVDALIIPHDLKELLDRAGVLSTFNELNDSYKRNLLRFIKLAKSDATRKKRISKIVDSVVSGVRLKNM